MATTPLQQLIIERIQREGALTFAAYMRMALYEPNYGYYVAGPPKIGFDGADYFTSTDVSSTFFANCMGRQLAHWWEKLGRPAHFVVLEQGAGRGDLARGIQAWARSQASDYQAALDYRVEDIRLGQDSLAPLDGKLEQATHAQRYISTPTLHAPIAPSVIISNELIDAFPVHI